MARPAVRLPVIMLALIFLGCLLLPVAGRAAEVEALTNKADIAELVFQGNEFFSESQLRSLAAYELADLNSPAYGKSAADDAAFQMETSYKKAGFAFAAVRYLYEPGPDNSSKVSFIIEEGPRVLLADLVFSGNTFFSTDLLQTFFQGAQHLPAAAGSSFYVEADIKKAISKIIDLYYSEGFPEAVVRLAGPVYTDDRSRVALHLEIIEGRCITIERIEISGDLVSGAAAGLEKISTDLTGLPFFKRRKLLIRSRITEIYGNLGYPDVEVRVEEKTPAAGGIILTADIKSGPLVSIAGLSVIGNNRTQTSFINSRLALGAGDLFSLDKKRESFRSIYETGLFSRVDITLEPAEKPETRILKVEVAEAPSREMFFESGWGSYEMLRLGAGFRDRNFHGSGRIIRSEGRVSFKGENLLLSMTDPWFLGTDLVADLPLKYSRRQEPSFTRKETGLSFVLSKKLTKILFGSLEYSFRLTSITDLDANVSLENTDTGYNMASIKAQTTWDTRNDPFLPTSGYRNFIAAETADIILGSDVALLRFTAGARFFLPLTSDLTLGFRYNTGLTAPGRNQVSLPLGERFYNGGENTVRSFRESRLGPLDLDGDPVGGMAFNVASIELRRRLAKNFAMSLFADLGNVSPNRSRAEDEKPAFSESSQVLETTLSEYFRDFRPAIGIGCQYLLPVGPVRLDLAWNPDQREKNSEEQYNIHFSIGMAF